MGAWSVDSTSVQGILKLKLSGALTETEMQDFVTAHNRAVDEYGGRDYKVWCDISELAPLRPECAAIFEQAKRYSSAHDNFRGSSVLVSSAMVALQHRRTSTGGGVIETELISEDVAMLKRHLQQVYRRSGGPVSSSRTPASSKLRLPITCFGFCTPRTGIWGTHFVNGPESTNTLYF